MSQASVRSVLLTPDLPPLHAVQLPDGEIGATLRSLCAMLRLNVLSQQRRIIRSRDLRTALVRVTVATRGGPQEMAVLLAWVIPLWVIGIQTNRLDATRRATIEIIQRQAVQALYRAFSRKDAPMVEAPESEIIVPRRDAAERRQALEAARRDLAWQVAALQRDHDERIAALQRDLIDQVAGLRHELAAQATLQYDQGEQIARLQADLAEQIAALRHEHATQIAALARRLLAAERLLAAATVRLFSHEHRPAQQAIRQRRKRALPRRRPRKP